MKYEVRSMKYEVRSMKLEVINHFD